MKRKKIGKSVLRKGPKILGMPEYMEEYETRQKMFECQEKRSEHARKVDEALKAPMAPTAEAWMKHPELYDVPHVDEYIPTETRKRIQKFEKEEKAKREKIKKVMPEVKKLLAEAKELSEKWRRARSTVSKLKIKKEQLEKAKKIRALTGDESVGKQFEADYKAKKEYLEKEYLPKAIEKTKYELREIDKALERPQLPSWTKHYQREKKKKMRELESLKREKRQIAEL